MATLRTRLGQRARELRREQQLTQTELAAKMGMNYRYVGAIERGEVNVTADSIERIAEGLAVPPYRLFLFSPSEKRRTDEEITDEQLRTLLSRSSPEIKELIVQVIRACGKLD